MGVVMFILLCVAVGAIIIGVQQWYGARHITAPSQPITKNTKLASQVLDTLQIKGRAPKTGYTREQFGNGWGTIGGCDTRNYILHRDMTAVKIDTDNCTVLSGTLGDPYTGKIIDFKRGPGTSSAVQIDHVVALSDAWQKGAQQFTAEKRVAIANDQLNLLAVDGPTNQQKSDGDAATWLPPNKDYRCRYVARQVAVKARYKLWVTLAEHDAISRILARCPSQVVPITVTAAP